MIVYKKQYRSLDEQSTQKADGSRHKIFILCVS